MNTTTAVAELTPQEKRALLARLLAERADTPKMRPVSYAQSRLWFLDQLQPGQPVYNIPIPIPLNGFVDVDALRRSVNEIIRRHEALRTTIQLVDQKPVQVIAPKLEIGIPLISLIESAAPETEANRLAFQEGSRPFDLSKGPLIRVTILKLAANSHLLLVVMHHIVSDAWSIEVFLRELSALYSAFTLNQPSPLPELSIQYADYAKWQAEWLSGPLLEEHLEYWRSKLKGLNPTLQLPLDRPRPRVQTHRGATETFMIEPDLLAELNALSRREGATLFMVVLAAFQTLLYRYTAETNFAVGSPIANRTRPETEGLIGFFVNTMVLRAEISPQASFRELLVRARHTTLEAYEHQDLPFEKLIEELQPIRDTAHNPLFQVLLTVHHGGEKTVDPKGALISNGTAKFDLTAVIVEAGDRAQGFFEYNTDLFDQSTILTLSDRFYRLLTAIVQDPDRDVRALPLGPEVEAVQQEEQTGKTPSVPEMVAIHAQERPEAIAFLSRKSQMTYAELDRAVNRYARSLASQGIQAGRRLAIRMDCDVQKALTVIAAMRLGTNVLAVDSREPAQRLEQILTEAQAELLEMREAPAGDQQEDGAAAVAAEAGACLVCRSSPKGDPITLALSQRMLGRSRLASSIRLDPSDRVAWHSGFAQDASLVELFGALHAGATIVALSDLRTPLQIARALRDHEITVLYVSCRLLKQLSQEFPWSLRKSRLVFVAAESLSSLQDLRSALSPDIFTKTYVLSGWTEGGGPFLSYPLAELAEQAPTLPLGLPFPGTHVDVLDDGGKPVPEGIVGEIVVDGWHTGDFVTRKADGCLMFQGRRDDRVQISGVRVEAAEIEKALHRHGSIDNAVVVAYPPPQPPGLVAFVIWRGDDVATADLQAFLKDSLLPEMIPESFYSMKEFPLAQNGAVDRRALRARLATGRTGAALAPYVAPRNDLEKQIADIWAQALGSDRIGVYDNFFSRGGHSLLATQVVAKIGDFFKVRLSLRRMFEKPTVAELAEELAKQEPEPSLPVGDAIPRVPRDQQIPLSFAQQRLWFLDQYEPGSAFYNMPIASRLRGSLDTRALRESVNALVRRHESLRTTFAALDGQPRQIIHSSLNLDVPVRDLQHLPRAEREPEAQRLAQEEARLSFDLVRGPLIRAQVLKLAADDHVLLLTIHHIVCDGWSIDVLFRELSSFYTAMSVGQEPGMPELPIQYADFACWQRELLSGPVLESQLGYWKEKLNGAPSLLELPTDRPRPRIQMFSGGMHTFSLPQSLLVRLHALCATEQITLFMALLAAFKAVLYRYTGQTDLVVGTPIANRVRPELEGLIGFFANTLVLRTIMSGEMSFRKLLQAIKTMASDAYANQDVPFEKLVEELAPERNLGYNPLFQVMFTLQNIGRVPLPGGGGGAVNPALGTGVAKFDLTVFTSETLEGIEAGVEYNSSLFDLETIVRMGKHFSMLLAAAVDDPDRSVEMLPLLSQAEMLARESWNGKTVPIPDCAVHQLFEAQARRTPEAIAVTAADSSEVTYRELNEIANGWAHRLCSLGLDPGSCVGIYMTRSVAMVTAVLAVLKAGMAYVPLDPNYPADRLTFMVQDARLRVILSERGLADGLVCPDARTWFFDDDDTPQRRSDSPTLHAHNDQLAYVIYTSGSTGRPKGVAMTHQPLVNLLEWQNKRSHLPPHAATLQFTSLSFDVSFQEIFSTLTSGGRLCLLREDQRLDPDAMWDVIEHCSIHRLFLPFVAFQQLAEAAARRRRINGTLREVITAGEQLKITPPIARFAESAGFELYNQYGPTETHVVTEFRLSGPASGWPGLPPIGKPIMNASIHILDRNRQPVPVCVAGEIYIGGFPLAQGYLHNPELTAERFVTGCAASPDERLYRTGDRGRFQKDGTIEFLGRTDRQVKIRGFRVELEEIEGALQRHPAVQAAAVIQSDKGAGSSRLIAYVQLRSDQQISEKELRNQLTAFLPDHMIPNIIVFIARIPLTPSGKLDRKALPDSSKIARDQSTSFTPPRTPIEEMLAGIWRELLEVDQVDIHDSFFELGGHSLLATRVISRIREELNITLPVRQLFETPSISALALSLVHGAVEDDEELEMLLREIENDSGNVQAAS